MNNKCGYTGEKLYTAVVYYYGTLPDVQNTFRMVFRMDEEIDEGALRIALDKCQIRFPYLMVKIKKTFKEIKLLYNDAPVVIEKTEDTVVLGTKEVNRHLIALTYTGKQLVLSVYHGLMDACGALMFVRTLMYYYVMEKYNETPSSEGIRLIEDEISVEEYTDPYIAFSVDDSAESLLPPQEKKKPFRIDTDSRVTPCKPYCYYLKVPQTELMKYCRLNDASPATLFSLVIARAIKDLNPDLEEPILSGLAQNQRPILGAPESHYSNVGTLALEYDKKTQGLDFEKQNTVYRGKILLQSDEDNAKVSIRGSKKFYDFIQKIPLLWLKKAILGKIVKLNLKTRTFVVSYVGKADLGDCEKHIKEFYTDADAPGTNIMLEINAINDDFFLSFTQEWKEELYFDAFCKELDKLDLTHEVIEEGDFKIAGMHI